MTSTSVETRSAGYRRQILLVGGIGRLGVAFSGDAADVWGQLGRPVECFPLLLPEQALAGFDLVLDPAGEIPALDRVAEVPCAIDAAILRHLVPPQACGGARGAGTPWARQPAGSTQARDQ